MDLTNLIISMSWGEGNGELAQRANITISNFKSEKGYISDILKLCTLIYIFADGKEVFRGSIWEWEYKSALQKEITVIAYDKLIYATKSKDTMYFSSGKSTQSIVESICKENGITVSYSWESYAHGKMKYSAKAVSDHIITTLNEAQTKLNSKYVAIMDKDILSIKKRGTNADVFIFNTSNIINTSDKLSLDQLVTKVIVIANEDKEGRPPIEDTQLGDTKYGTLQEVITRGSNTKLADAQAEAKKIIKERGKPKETININSPDVPQLRKGDKIKVVAGNLSGYFFIVGITHNATDKKMDMEVERE